MVERPWYQGAGIDVLKGGHRRRGTGLDAWLAQC